MYLTLAPILWQRWWPRAHTLVRELILILGGSLILAALAQVRIPLPFSPVPVTGQTLGVLLIGAVLGSGRGSAAVLAYLAQGLLGLPVFTGGGSGLAYLAGPTGGYLLGFAAAAYLVGSLAERGLERRWRTVWLPFLAGEAVIYLCGLAWLALFVGPTRSLQLGLLPFLAGDAVKIILAALALPAAWKLVK